jgi:UDPglucose--hexose-1-phosphate uridylyltransferase
MSLLKGVLVIMKKSIIQLINYALNRKLIDQNNIDNSILCITKALKEKTFKYTTYDYLEDDKAFLDKLLDIAIDKKIILPYSIDEKDAFEALLYDCVMPSPNIVKKNFQAFYQINPLNATSYLYKLSEDVNYIKTKRLASNNKWIYEGKYGKLQMTINLSKPEKDPRDIAAAKNQVSIQKDLSTPKCVICKENEQNYHNARMNLRIAPITLGNEIWHFQYSPYLYYNEHAIILHDEHRPMKIYEKTFTYLFDFLDQFPKYFIGSNADLPIVGGSILNHDHFQGGNHQFPIQDAKVIHKFKTTSHVEISHLNWPISTIRLSSKDRISLEKLATFFLNQWKDYQNLDLNIISYTDGIPHNTITPIARKLDNIYELDLVLRNNKTTNQYPLGIFHPHDDVHHIKKENIGLIEAMGLAILPGRLKEELKSILDWLNNQKELPKDLEKHHLWMIELSQIKLESYTEVWLLNEVGKKFERVIEDSGVFKLDSKGNDSIHKFIIDTIKKF